MIFHRAWPVVLIVLLLAAFTLRRSEAARYRMLVKTLPETGVKCVSASKGPFVEGMRVFLWDCNADVAQNLEYDDQTQLLKFGANCVQVLGQGNAEDGVGVDKCNGGPNQHWNMVENRDVYQIVGLNGFCLNVSNGVMANGTPLGLAKCASNNTAQLWELYQASDATAVQTTSQPPPESVMTILARHGLIGTFGEDCTKDPGESNQYILHRALDAQRVERDQMKGRALRSYAAAVENAQELTANDVAMNIVITETIVSQMKDWRMRLVTRVDGNRMRLMESEPLTGPYAGQKNVSAGKAANGGGETHWLTKCD